MQNWNISMKTLQEILKKDFRPQTTNSKDLYSRQKQKSNRANERLIEWIKLK